MINFFLFSFGLFESSSFVCVLFQPMFPKVPGHEGVG